MLLKIKMSILEQRFFFGETHMSIALHPFCPPPFRRKAEGHSIWHFVLPTVRPPKVVGILCAQLLLQFYADSFETLQMFLSWSEDMHMVGILFRKLNFVIFWVNRKWVPCVHTSFYSFMPILLKLHMCFGHGLKTYMRFGYNPQIICRHFFHNLNIVVFRHYYYQHM